MTNEDSPEWRTVSKDVKQPAAVEPKCTKCKIRITLWHCQETGCPWCAECGTKAKSKDGSK